MNNYIIEVLALGMFFVYQLEIFKYSSRILIKSNSKKPVFYGLAIINSLLYISYLWLDVSFVLFYLVIMIVLGIEFKLISQSGMIQCFCGSSIFAMHIAAVHIPVLTLYAWVNNYSPVEIMNHLPDRAIVMYISCFILGIILIPLVEMIIDPIHIQRITVTDKYSQMLLMATTGGVVYQTILSATVISNGQYIQQFWIACASSIFVTAAFYFVFIYGISLVNASFYKRKTDEIMNEKENIEVTKMKLHAMIESDSLTGVYSRKYIMSLLESLVHTEFVSFTILFVDINALKFTNDVYGHEAGDRLIVKVAEALQEGIRENDSVARLGGDEFLVVIDSDSTEAAAKVIRRIERNIENKNKEEEFLVAASLGALYVDEEAKNKGIDYILSTADAIMRENKEKFYKKEEEV